MADTIGIIAMGEMGSGVARRVHERGATVITQLTGRTAASAARAERAGAIPVATDDEFAAQADFILSIVPPGDAVALAQRLAPAIRRAGRKAVYVDCNAVSPQTAARIGDALDGSGCTYVDAGIIGPPPGPNARTIFYASGPGAKEFERLAAYGLTIRIMDGPNGAASAMKLSYAGITKGCTAIGAAMMLGATRGGTADALLQELSESQPMLLNWMRGFVSRMPPKAYRWVAEMEEIAQFQADDPAARDMYLGIARFYQQIAAMLEAPKPGDAVSQLQEFCADRPDAKRKSA
ncbi:MAG: NAD(P)-dependent oxidoreductase [Alphaproteobacteria bacterium]|nr:MAG: NAD(P)-dependent oxidoreductase [Alphaproteobacteria bacterium]